MDWTDRSSVGAGAAFPGADVDVPDYEGQFELEFYGETTFDPGVYVLEQTTLVDGLTYKLTWAQRLLWADPVPDASIKIRCRCVAENPSPWTEIIIYPEASANLPNSSYT